MPRIKEPEEKVKNEEKNSFQSSLS